MIIGIVGLKTHELIKLCEIVANNFDASIRFSAPQGDVHGEWGEFVQAIAQYYCDLTIQDDEGIYITPTPWGYEVNQSETLEEIIETSGSPYDILLSTKDDDNKRFTQISRGNLETFLLNVLKECGYIEPGTKCKGETECQDSSQHLQEGHV